MPKESSLIPPDSIANLIFAHGAGNDQFSDFMQASKALFERQGVCCHLFDFSYMEKARELGKRRPPDKLDKLRSRFLAEIDDLRSSNLPIFIGGKSMGGRVATMVLEESVALGAICFGYPFHPPGKPEKIRTAHLLDINKPVCIVQGERDPFGKPAEVASYNLDSKVEVHFLLDGEHSFKTLKRSAVTSQENLQKAVNIAVNFIQGRSE